MKSPDQKVKHFSSMREEYGAGNTPHTAAEGLIAGRVRKKQWENVQAAFADLSVAEAGVALEKVGQGLSTTDHNELLTAFTKGVIESLKNQSDAEKNKILEQMRSGRRI